MHELDSDNKLLIGSTGREAVRDIVQFVRFKKYKQMGADVLAEKALREVPEQFLSYMNMKGIKPEASGAGEVNKKRISQELYNKLIE